MGADKAKAVHHDDKKKKGDDIDVDAEHNKDISRRASNADLKKHAHADAETSSFGSVQASMSLLSREFYDGTIKLKELIHSDTSQEQGAEPAIQMIHELYDRTLDDAMRVSDLINTVNKNDAHLLSAEIKQAQGTGFMFAVHMHRAASWITEQVGHEKDPLLDENKIKNIVDGYTAAVGIDGEMDQNRHAPDGDEMTLTKQVVHDEVDALEKAINSAAAGNSDDVKRITLHARTLDNFAKDHGLALKSAHSKLLTMQATLDKVRSETNDDRLNEAANHLAGLIGRHS